MSEDCGSVFMFTLMHGLRHAHAATADVGVAGFSQNERRSCGGEVYSRRARRCQGAHLKIRKPGNTLPASRLLPRSMSDQAFVQLVDAYYAPLYRFALSLARNAADAGDLVQQTFFIWATKGETLRESSKAKAWLFTTLYREFLRLRRRDARATSLEELPVAEQEIPDKEIDLVRRLDGDAVMTALQSIDELFRAPLTLFYLEEMSYQEIAAAIEVPIGTVMSRLARGKVQLRAVLAGRLGAADEKVINFPRQKVRS